MALVPKIHKFVIIFRKLSTAWISTKNVYYSICSTLANLINISINIISYFLLWWKLFYLTNKSYLIFCWKNVVITETFCFCSFKKLHEWKVSSNKPEKPSGLSVSQELKIIKSCHASAMLVLCKCYTSDMQVLCKCSTNFLQVLCKCYASAMQVLCKCYASALQVLCKCYASIMQVLCKCYACAM